MSEMRHVDTLMIRNDEGELQIRARLEDGSDNCRWLVDAVELPPDTTITAGDPGLIDQYEYVCVLDTGGRLFMRLDPHTINIRVDGKHTVAVLEVEDDE